MHVREVDYILCGQSSIRLSAAMLCVGVKDLISELVSSAKPVSPLKSLQRLSWAGTVVFIPSHWEAAAYVGSHCVECHWCLGKPPHHLSKSYICRTPFSCNDKRLITATQNLV